MASLEERAARVRAAHAYSKLSQSALAGKMGQSVETVSRIENARRAVSDAELVLIAEACGVPYEFMESGFDLIRERGRALTQAALVRRLDELEDRVRELVAQQARTALEAPTQTDATRERPSRPRRRPRP